MVFCVDYTNKYAFYLNNPKTWTFWAMIDLHDYLMFFLINILIIVLCFTAVCLLQQKNFSNKAWVLLHHKSKLSRFSHAPLLEFFWTLLPAFLLVVMGWPSFRVLFSMEQLIDPFNTVIILGNQWYWTYQYSDFDLASEIIVQLDSKRQLVQFKAQALLIANLDYNLVTQEDAKKNFKNRHFFQHLSKHLRKFEESKFIYDAVIIPDEDLPLGYPRLLCTDQVLVLPAYASMRLLITSSDVIHSWALPSHGIKMDAVPGRVNQVAFMTNCWGTYWGQCSELCGINHGFMPIEVRVIPMIDYVDYLKLNISFREDKLVPAVENFLMYYLKYSKIKSEEGKISRMIQNDIFDQFLIKNRKTTNLLTSSLFEIKAYEKIVPWSTSKKYINFK